MEKKQYKIVTREEVLDKQHSLLSLRNITASIDERKKYQPCDTCKERKDFLNRMFKGGK